MSSRRTVVPMLVCVALTATGCAGPKQHLDFGGKAVPINVAFGKPPPVKNLPLPPGTVLKPAPSGIGVVPVVPGLPGTGGGAPSPAPLPTGGPALVEPCPAQDPFKFPRYEASNVVERDAPEGLFPYRTSGSYTVNGKKTPYAQTVYETVKRLDTDAAGRKRFSVKYSLLGVPYTLTYSVLPPPDPNIPGEIGLESIARDSTDGTGATFTPVKPLRLLQLRAEKGVSWTEATTDPLSASSATVDGTIADKVRVNACGQPVEAWKAQVTQRLITPGQDVTATRTLYFATGYGGLLVGEQTTYTGTAGGDTISGESTTLINVDPAASS